MHTYVVTSCDPDGDVLVCGVFSTHEAAMPVVQLILAEKCAITVTQWEVDTARRIAMWFYDETYNGHYTSLNPPQKGFNLSGPDFHWED